MRTEQLVSDTALCDLPDRIVVSPGYGRLVVRSAQTFTSEGEVVRAGEVLATVEANTETIEVRSPCDAWVLSFLAGDGERVRPGVPIVHLREL